LVKQDSGFGIQDLRFGIGEASLRVPTFERQNEKILMTLSIFVKKSMANYTTRRTIWRDQSPIASLGLLLFEKNIIGAFGNTTKQHHVCKLSFFCSSNRVCHA
jgi:hypothetical protein